MKIPFALHRKLPPVRRVLDLLARTAQERDDLREKLESCVEALHRQSQLLSDVRAEIAEYKRPRYPYIVADASIYLNGISLKILTLLRPMDVVGKNLLRKGRPYDGGYVMLDHGINNSIAYSLGINDDVSWDMDMAELGCQIYQYDHTIDSLPIEHPSFHWKKIGIDAGFSDDGKLRPLDALINENGHAKRHDLILKMDIEGFEWRVFDQLSEETLSQFSQIVMEQHSLALAPPEQKLKIIAALEKLNRTHQVVHVHANNHGYMGFLGGVPIPDTLEATYVRRSDHEFTECHRIFPSEIDMPCRPDVPDYFLGALGVLPAAQTTGQTMSGEENTPFA